MLTRYWAMPQKQEGIKMEPQINIHTLIDEMITEEMNI